MFSDNSTKMLITVAGKPGKLNIECPASHHFGYRLVGQGYFTSPVPVGRGRKICQT